MLDGWIVSAPSDGNDLPWLPRCIPTFILELPKLLEIRRQLLRGEMEHSRSLAVWRYTWAKVAIYPHPSLARAELFTMLTTTIFWTTENTQKNLSWGRCTEKAQKYMRVRRRLKNRLFPYMVTVLFLPFRTSLRRKSNRCSCVWYTSRSLNSCVRFWRHNKR